MAIGTLDYLEGGETLDEFLKQFPGVTLQAPATNLGFTGRAQATGLFFPVAAF